MKQFRELTMVEYETKKIVTKVIIPPEVNTKTEALKYYRECPKELISIIESEPERRAPDDELTIEPVPWRRTICYTLFHLPNELMRPDGCVCKNNNWCGYIVGIALPEAKRIDRGDLITLLTNKKMWWNGHYRKMELMINGECGAEWLKNAVKAIQNFLYQKDNSIESFNQDYSFNLKCDLNKFDPSHKSRETIVMNGNGGWWRCCPDKCKTEKYWESELSFMSGELISSWFVTKESEGPEEIDMGGVNRIGKELVTVESTDADEAQTATYDYFKRKG